jgi:hypothetical protein
MVRANAVKHGLRSVSPVVEGLEREPDWRRHLEGLVASLVPAGDLEAALAERIALLLWRLRRVTLFERETMQGEVERVEKDWDKIVAFSLEHRSAEERARYLGEPQRVVFVRDRSTRRVLSNGDAVERVIRYEAHLHRQLVGSMHELEALQARRRGEVTPLARLDVAGEVGG